MASQYLHKFPVPPGFQDTLADLTTAILRDQPSNIIQYAAEYFESLENGVKLPPSLSVNRQSAPSSIPSAHAIPTQKTITPEVTDNYLSNLAAKINSPFEDREQEEQEQDYDAK